VYVFLKRAFPLTIFLLKSPGVLDSANLFHPVRMTTSLLDWV